MSLASALIEYASSGGKSLTPIYKALSERKRYTRSTLPANGGEAGYDGHDDSLERTTTPNGEILTLPTSWKGTHDTSGADWNANAATATDIMARAGTIVGAPEPGTVIRHGSAQGGESVYFQGDSGRVYWMGHIANALPVGSRVRKRGGRVALVSAEHAAPHVHLDYVGK